MAGCGGAAQPKCGHNGPPSHSQRAIQALTSALDGQLYVVLGQASEGGRRQLRLWWKPLVTLIWLGGALIAIGGLLSLVGRLWRERRPGHRPRDAEVLA